MDLKLVIKQMLDKGLSREEIIGNLKELGVSDAEKLFDEAVPPQPVSKPQAPVQREEVPSLAGRGLFKEIPEEQPPARQRVPEVAEEKPSPARVAERKGDGEISISDLVEKKGKSIFGEREPEKEREEESLFEKPLVEEEREMPVITSSRGGRIPASAEEKIDEVIALLKALQVINQKILETDRRLLLREKE
ncbi:MAG: hypothetical protein V1717_01675 [Candidatus Micrarchaeota archaeon]